MSKLRLLKRAARNCAAALPGWALAGVWSRQAPWVFVTEEVDWAIRQEGLYMLAQLDRRGVHTRMTEFPFFVRDSVLHFGSLNTFKPPRKRLGSFANRHVLTCFHGDYGIEPHMDRALDTVLAHAAGIDRLVVTNQMMKARFIGWGFPQDRLRLIPVGVDLDRFKPVSDDQRERARARLRLEPDAVVIGSFQKDGVGWGDGDEPKLIKGPDVFCDVVERLARSLPVHVLLTGPARGYVKRRLSLAGIPFTHHHLSSPDALPDYYAALDLYLMCSREEGGPKAVPESLACRIPVVTTRTGVAGDLEGLMPEWPWVCEVGDVDGLVASAESALTDAGARQLYRDKAVEITEYFGWERIGTAYHQIYRELTA